MPLHTCGGPVLLGTPTFTHTWLCQLDVYTWKGTTCVLEVPDACQPRPAPVIHSFRKHCQTPRVARPALSSRGGLFGR